MFKIFYLINSYKLFSRFYRDYLKWIDKSLVFTIILFLVYFKKMYVYRLLDKENLKINEATDVIRLN